MSKQTNVYYIGRIKCDTNNSMMQEIAELMKGYEFCLLYEKPSVWYDLLKMGIDIICSRHKRCIPVNLQMMEMPSEHGYTIYARKPGIDHSILCITLLEVLDEIVPLRKKDTQ